MSLRPVRANPCRRNSVTAALMIGWRCLGTAGMSSPLPCEEIILIGLHQPLKVKPKPKTEGSMTERVGFELDSGIARITLDDGKVNVMSTAMLADIAAALDRAEGRADI